MSALDDQLVYLYLISFTDELYGDFEDLETGEVHQGESESDENEDNKGTL